MVNILLTKPGMITELILTRLETHIIPESLEFARF